MNICLRKSLKGHRANKLSNPSLHSFTLVEVVISIGIASFALISILGIMAYAATTVQQADKYARLTSVASQALANVGTMPFGNSLLGKYWRNVDTSLVQTNYYTYEGLPTNSASGSSTYYVCVLADASPSPPYTYTNSYTVAKQQIMEPVTLTIMWPAQSGPPYANTNTIVTSILNYGSL
jgi:type II secretory pathway pseudopilin PulG